MRRIFLFPATMAAVVATMPGVAEATSTTCATTVVCAEFINTSSGVAIHGEANTGIGIRGTSVTNTGERTRVRSDRSTARGRGRLQRALRDAKGTAGFVMRDR